MLKNNFNFNFKKLYKDSLITIKGKSSTIRNTVESKLPSQDLLSDVYSYTLTDPEVESLVNEYTELNKTLNSMDKELSSIKSNNNIIENDIELLQTFIFDNSVNNY